ncbi:MAG: hypothetical protein JO064_09020, partial [Actinobacteria bacterium]|nr:hypothetical protein [Actinomycetota bacterium]
MAVFGAGSASGGGGVVLPAGSSGAAAASSPSELYVVGGSGSNAVLAGTSVSTLHRIARLRSSRGDGAAFVIPSLGGLYLVGGTDGGGKPVNRIVRVDLKTHAVSDAGPFTEPLSGAVALTYGNDRYVVGGWDGKRYATAVLFFVAPGDVRLVARLPVGVRWPAAAIVGNTLYVAGGLSKNGPSRAIDAVDLRLLNVKRIGTLPSGVYQATMAVSGGSLYVFGGRDAHGDAVSSVVRIDPRTGAARPAGSLPQPMAGVVPVDFHGGTLFVDGASRTVTSPGALLGSVQAPAPKPTPVKTVKP